MTARIRTAIVDDEPLARSALRLALDADAELEVVGECVDGIDAAERLPALAPDALFLDVRMPGCDGFEVLRRTRLAPAALVFVTAHDDYALRAFDAQALDYLLKPFDDERLARAIARAKAQVRQQRAGDLADRLAAVLDPAAARSERLAVRDGSRVRFVATDDIDWIAAQDYYVEIHARGQAHLVREPLRDLASRLDPARFVRIHRSVVVNIARIAELRSLDAGEGIAVLGDGTELRISRSRRAEVYARLGVALPRP
jgi:two-component system, LytTR family, response regulator